MNRETLRHIAELLQPHIIAWGDKPHLIGPQFLSVSEATLAEHSITSESFLELPLFVYDGPEILFKDGRSECFHVFLRTGLDRLLGAGWQQSGGINKETAR